MYLSIQISIYVNVCTIAFGRLLDATTITLPHTTAVPFPDRYVSAFFKNHSVPVKCMCDAGMFLDIETVTGAGNVMQTRRVAKLLPFSLPSHSMLSSGQAVRSPSWQPLLGLRKAGCLAAMVYAQRFRQVRSPTLLDGRSRLATPPPTRPPLIHSSFAN
jgi:hypothetical protein